MRRKHLKYLACPTCKKPLNLSDIKAEEQEDIQTGTLICLVCCRHYEIIRHIPRFVPSKNYAASFSLQ